MKTRLLAFALALVSTISGADFALAQSTSYSQSLDRMTLPIKEPARPTFTELDVRKAPPPPHPFQVTAPKGAPNVVFILLDDFGFGASSAFGGPITMPTAEQLANEGLRFNTFHTTSLCSPTREVLLTGRNHHSANFGSITETATGYPGNTGKRPQDITPLAEILRQNGYNTAHFGKAHETAPWEVSVSGPFDRWPTGSGMEYFYGFVGAETNQWNPGIYEGTTRIEDPSIGKPGYHFLVDMTDHAITWLRARDSLTPDKPFFMYFAPGATHAPHHVPKEWIAKWKGKFDMGWDKLREQTLARQIAMGIVPAGTKLAPKPPGLKDWDQLSDAEKKVYERQMEVYAAYAAFADHEVGRLIDALREQGKLDNTLVFYILGDNGASAEGGVSGAYNEQSIVNGAMESLEEVTKNLDELGGPKAYNIYAVPWAVALDSPFSWHKMMANDFGGTRNALIVHWPADIKQPGLRTQFSHVVDIAPTVLEAAHIPQPVQVNGIKQHPMEGISMLYTFNDPKAKGRHTTQYFEIFGNRAIYHDGWIAGAEHHAMWQTTPIPAFTDDKWALYHIDQDFSESTDLSAKYPEKLKELQALFVSEATKYHALPLDDRTAERLNPAVAGRPDLMGGRTSLTVYNGVPGMMENAFINMKNRSFTVTTDVDIPKGGANGVILCQGGRFGGWSFYFKNGRPTYHYNWLGRDQYTVAAAQAVPTGKATIRLEFDYDGGGYGKGGTATIYVNDKKVASGRIDKTQPNVFSGDETADVGRDTGTPVSDDYSSETSRFTGQLTKVTIQLLEADKKPVSAADQKAYEEQQQTLIKATYD